MYERRLRDKNLMDYDDLLLMPLRIMNEHKDILRTVQNGLRFMFVDEYQDLNPLQINLLKTLAHAELHITIIGDPDQSIYGFRGVGSDHFINFTADFPNVEVLRLKDNYRSTKAIIDAAQCVISHNQSQFPRILNPRKSQGAHPRICTFNSAASEAIFVAHEIGNLLAAQATGPFIAITQPLRSTRISLLATLPFCIVSIH